MFKIYCPKANSIPKGLQLEGLASTWSLDNPQILEKHYSLSDSFYWWDATVWKFHTRKSKHTRDWAPVSSVWFLNVHCNNSFQNFEDKLAASEHLEGMSLTSSSCGNNDFENLRKPFSFLRCCCLVAQSCLTLCGPVDFSPPGSSVHGILQARILECVAISSSRGSS